MTFKRWRSTRRRFLTNTTAVSATLAAAPFIRTARTASSLKLAIWDHWIPGANEAFIEIINAWESKNHVAVTVDFISNEQVKTLSQSEARAGSGHDIIELPNWAAWSLRHVLEPVDEVVTRMRKSFGELTEGAQLIAQVDGVWRALPVMRGAMSYPMASRIDLVKEYAGIDLMELFPPSEEADRGRIEKHWNLDTFLAAAKALHQGGYPYGAAISSVADGTHWLASFYNLFGATLVDASGAISVDSDATRHYLEYLRELSEYMPAGIHAWDNGSNNRWLVSGKGAMICNPPSAWSIALEDQPEIGKMIYHHPLPQGPGGRFRSFPPLVQGVWQFSKNIQAAKDLLTHIYAEPENVAKIVQASKGYDQPHFKDYHHPIWETSGPPAGTLFHYPIRADEFALTPAWPAPPKAASLLATDRFLVRLTERVTHRGESSTDAIAWATRELESLLA